MAARVAVVLSGCGVYDGSEIQEAVSVLVHLSRAGAAYECFAPDREAPVVDHLTGSDAGERRNVLRESARIARGKIRALAELRAEEFDAVVFPGGFGAAKNLCDFATLRRVGRRARLTRRWSVWFAGSTRRASRWGCAALRR